MGICGHHLYLQEEMTTPLHFEEGVASLRSDEVAIRLHFKEEMAIPCTWRST